jgi:hypothetical protein
MIDAADPDVQALVAALAAQVVSKIQADAEAASANATIDLALSRLVDAVAFAVAIEEEVTARIADSLDGLTVAIERAWRWQVETHATRPLKVAVFNAEGRFVGVQDGRADLINLQQPDGFTRLAWRSEWNDLPMVAEAETGPRRFALRPDMPALAAIPNVEAEVVGQMFGMFAAEALRP